MRRDRLAIVRRYDIDPGRCARALLALLDATRTNHAAGAAGEPDRRRGAREVAREQHPA